MLQHFSLSVRNLFHIVGPLKATAKRVIFKLKSHFLKLLSENLVGYKWSFNKNTWLNTQEFTLFLTLNINKRYCRMLIWYKFKMLNSFIKSIDGIEISSEDISMAACFCFPRILFRKFC